MSANVLSYRDVIDTKRRGDEMATSNVSLRLVTQRIKATGATTCGVVALAKKPGAWKWVRQILHSMQFGHLLLRIRFEREDATEQLDDVVVFVPSLDAIWAARLARHVDTLVLADLSAQDGLAEAILRLRPGWRVAGFDLPPSSYVEALADVASRAPVV